MNLDFFARSLAIIAAVSVCHFANSADSPAAGRGFSSAQEAATALQRALSSRDLPALREMFGPGLTNLINPDLVQATNEFETVASLMTESNRVVASGEKRMVIEYGSDRIPFAVPLVQEGGSWRFDTEAGAEELINRRIGRNELAVLDAVRTYVQAQREYSTFDRDGDDVLEYAQRFASTEGNKDGLYWPLDLDGSMSPLGPLVAGAQAEGYRKKSEEPEPFHGYYFRILTRQGKSVPGGSYDYVINGNMIGGFALIAWPAEYDVTGIMTFVVNQQGRVYQKDLGPKTAKIAKSSKAYDPDKTWSPSAD